MLLLMGQLEEEAVPALNLPFYDLLTDICLSLFRFSDGTVCLCFVAMHVDGYSFPLMMRRSCGPTRSD